MDELETCSWCTTEVPDRTLTEALDGARVCAGCAADPANAPYLPAAR